MITSFSFAFSLLGLTLGTVLAQILLALVFMFLPVVLLLSAVPSQSARALLPKVAKLAFFAAMAHAVFLLVLTSMVLLIDILTNAVVASTNPGSVIRIIFLAAVPIAAKKILGAAAKKIGLDITSVKGSLRTTSGMAAASLGSDRSGMADKANRYGRSLTQTAYYAGAVVKDRSDPGRPDDAKRTRAVSSGQAASTTAVAPRSSAVVPRRTAVVPRSSAVVTEKDGGGSKNAGAKDAATDGRWFQEAARWSPRRTAVVPRSSAAAPTDGGSKKQRGGHREGRRWFQEAARRPRRTVVPRSSAVAPRWTAVVPSSSAVVTEMDGGGSKHAGTRPVWQPGWLTSARLRVAGASPSGTVDRGASTQPDPDSRGC